MSRVLLVKCGDVSPWRVGNEVSPPLGLMYLAAYARRQRPGKDVFRLVDQRTSQWGPRRWVEVVREFRPDCIGLSALTVESDSLRELARGLKTAFPDIPLVAGGPHATAVRAALLDEAPVDYVVGGEAEMAFVDLLEALERGERDPARPISGLCRRRADGELIEIPNNVSQPEIEELPFPAYDLIDIGVYENFRRMSPLIRGRYTGIFTSRGCPYRCTYCHEVFEKGFRAMTPTRVVDEMAYVVENYGVRQFEFYDDIFNADPRRAIEVCREVVRRGLDVQLCYPNGLRADRLPDELIHALREAGTIEISFAIETASERLQKMIRKHMKLDKLRAAVTLAERLGILCYGFFMLGFPTETRAEAEETIELALSLPLHGAGFWITVPYVGTEMYDGLAREKGVAGTTDLASIGMQAAERQYTADPNYASSTLSEMSPAELKRLQRRAYFRFYCDAARIRRILRWAPLDGREVVLRAIKQARFMVGALPGAGRVGRQLHRVRGLLRGETAAHEESWQNATSAAS